MKAKKYDLLWVFLIALIPCLICIALFSSPMRTPMDELGTLSTGIFWWKRLTALTTFAKIITVAVYNTICTTVLFDNNVTVICGTILSVCALLQSISAPISYYIMKKYLKVDKRAYLFIGSIACSFMVVTRAMEVFNEHIVIGCVWIITLFACKLIEYGNNKKEKNHIHGWHYVFNYIFAYNPCQNKGYSYCFLYCCCMLSYILQKVACRTNIRNNFPWSVLFCGR